MPSPSDYQQDFVAALRDPQAPPPAALVGRHMETPAKRFDVYRNNVHVSLIEVLAARFPIIERLVGAEFFRAMARAFIARALPRSPVLIEYGGDFADFVDGFSPAQVLPYLGDVARLEWAWHEAYHAADMDPMGPALLSMTLYTSEPDRFVRKQLALHPSLRIVRSDWPVLDIWRTNTEDTEVRPVDSDAGGEDVLVVRPQWDITLCPLPAAGADFVEAIASGATLGDAAERAAHADTVFDPTTILQLLVATGCITGSSDVHDHPTAEGCNP